MNKKINFLSIVPFLGSIIILFLMFIKSYIGKINKKKFKVYFFTCGLVMILSVIFAFLSMFIINEFIIDIIGFIDSYGFLCGIIISGYIWNLYTFILFNKHWKDLELLE